jgi:hypothetical protein
VGDKWKTRVNSFGSRELEWESSVGDKWKTSVYSCGPRHPECETSAENKYQWDASPETEAKLCSPGI